jgi:hypothetical protein
MNRTPAPDRRAGFSPAAFLAWAAVFAVLYAQSPLYTSNQNQYFLHGLAWAGLGSLRLDWLANTPDPTPLFSLLVALTYTLGRSGWLFYVEYALLLGVYLVSAYGLMDLLFDLRSSRTRSLAFLALFLAAHSALLRYLLSRLLGAEAAFLVEGGVAGQRLLGQVFQPSTFGVFLVLSLYLFLSGRRNAAVLALAVAVSFHPTYLLGGALLTLGYLWLLWRETGSLRAPFVYGLKLLLAVLPILLYTLLTFRPTDLELYAEAQAILVSFRIPQHAMVAEWLDWTVAVKAVLLAAALILVRRKPLFPILCLATGGLLALTLIEVLQPSNTLALLFPWRISVLLVPLAVCILLAALAGRLFPAQHKASRLWDGLLLAGIALLVAVGAARFQIETGRYRSDPARPLIDAVAAGGPTQDVYLVPVKWETFRLLSGQPAYIDFMAIPYRDGDVLAWYRRLLLADWFYRGESEPCAALQEFALSGGVTRVVLPPDHDALDCTDPDLDQIYRDEAFGVYSLP